MTTSRLLLAVALVVLAAGADWPQLHGPDRDQHSAETGLLPAFPKDGPPVVWQREVGEGFAGPVVARGRLVLFHRAGNDEVVECLDALTGRPRWKDAITTDYRDGYGKGDGPRATPLIAGDRVFTLGPQGRLSCLDFDSGRRLWQKLLLKDYEVRPGFFGVGSTPIVEGDRLIVNVGGKDGAGIVAFDRDSGKEVWRATDHGASYSSPVVATLDGKRSLVFFTREGLAVLDPADGAVRHLKHWRSRLDASVNAASPVIADGCIFLTACYGTGAVLLRPGKGGLEEVWKGDDRLSCHFGTPVAHQGFLYGFDGRQEQGTEFRCVELKTGKVRWSREGFGCGSLILAEGRLIVFSEGGDLVLVEATPEAYRERARAAVLKGPCWAPPALADGRLYARDQGRLVCWDLRRKP
jgi:outer membrane protein assembly factor BamB